MGRCSPKTTTLRPACGSGLPRSWSSSWPLVAGILAPRQPTRRVNETQLLSVLVDVNDIETSDPPRHPVVRRHLRGPGRKTLAALVLIGVALVIFGRLTLWTLLVIVAAAAIVAAAGQSRPKK